MTNPPPTSTMEKGGRWEGEKEVEDLGKKLVDGDGSGAAEVDQEKKTPDVDGSDLNGARDRIVDEEEDWDYYGPEPDLEDKFAGMHLHGEEEDDLDLSGEVDELIKGV